VLEPSEESLEVARFEPIKVAAPNAIETSAFLQNVGDVVAIREEDSAGDVVREAEECREFCPGQRRAPSSELDLVGLEFPEARAHDPVDAQVRASEAQLFADGGWGGGEWPGFFCLDDGLRGKVRLGKDLERLAALSFCW
jgi:hypothetical protein